VNVALVIGRFSRDRGLQCPHRNSRSSGVRAEIAACIGFDRASFDGLTQ